MLKRAALPKLPKSQRDRIKPKTYFLMIRKLSEEKQKDKKKIKILTQLFDILAN